MEQKAKESFNFFTEAYSITKIVGEPLPPKPYKPGSERQMELIRSGKIQEAFAKYSNENHQRS